MSKIYQKGRLGEDRALKYFLESGYLLLKRNFRARAEQPLSEIDLIFLALQKKASMPLRNEWIQIISRQHQIERINEFANIPDMPDFIRRAQNILYIVFVEVKNWKAYPIADLCYNLGAGRQRRMFQTAESFLQKHPDYAALSMRFDLVILNNDELRHIEAAFP